ncbi:alpha-2-macroglobulin family protein [Vibrio neonatus]|uniref:alpha-2-macroglobulin family protein n=1 Tax=Vibrio neonatus TaxID=278860 RepID=UPI0021C4A035|nr:MG2 domain-containing protein [Vibrio neonatus]
MRIHRKLFIQFFTLIYMLVFASSVFSATVTDVTEGKINGKTSIVVSLKGALSHPLDLPVVKDKKRVHRAWVLSEDRTFQSLSIDDFGVGEYSVSLAGFDREDLRSLETINIYEASPSVRVLGQGPFINATGDRAIPIESVNATGVLASIYRVDDTPKLFADYFYSQTLSNWSAQRLRKNFTHQTDLSFKLPAAKENASTVTNLKLPDNLANGWYIIAIKPSNSFDSPDIFHVLLSDIGVQAKVFDKKVSLQAVDLATHKPLQSAKVSIVGQNGVRDIAYLKDGFVQFDYGERSSEDVFVVQSGASVAVLPMKEVPLDLSDFKVDGQQSKSLSGYMFSNRDLFKPGEEVPLNIVLRKESGEITALNSLFMEVIAPDGKVILSRNIEESQKGFFNYRFTIPASAKLGKWSAVVRSTRQSKAVIGSFNFNVQEFVPERMDLTVSVPHLVMAGEPIKGQASGRYLFGQVADGNRLTISSTLRSIASFPGKYAHYLVGKQKYISSSNAPDDIDLKLDKQGKAHFTLNAVSKDALDGPAMLTTNNQLFETGGATTTRINKLLVSNGKSIVGLKPNSEDFGYFTKAKFSLLLLDDKGENTLSGDVRIKVERNRGGYYWVFNQSSGWDLRRDDNWRVTESKVMHVNAQHNELVVPVEWGDYRITAVAPSGQETVYSLYAGWEDGDTQIPVKPDQLSMKLDKESYLAGDYINVQVASPRAGLVSLELVADKTYLHKTVQVKGKQNIRLRLPNNIDRHDLYLIGSLVNSDKAYVRRSLAVAPVKLFRDHRKLAVSIQAPQRLEPFTTQTIKVKVDNAANLKDAYVVLTVADKGIINMSHYKVADIFNWFYGQKRLGADIIDLYSRQFESRPSPFIRHRYGGDEGINSSKPLNNLVESKTFNQVLPAVKLNQKGEANIQLQIPDYNGEVQMVATVFAGAKFGQKVQNVTVSAPIVAELSIPRFFATNNQSQVMVEASNQTKEMQKVTLSLRADDGIRLVGQSAKVLELAPQQKAHFAVQVEAGNKVTMTNLTLSVNSRAYQIERNWRVPVRSPSPYVTKKTTRTLAAGDFVNITRAQWQGVLPKDHGISTVSFSRVPEIEPTAFVQGLFNYPYGCVEQTTSTGYPWLLDDASLVSLKKEVLEERSDVDMLQKAVLRLADYQNGKGGFGLWGSYSQEEPWLTSYVASFLFTVNERYPNMVSNSVLDKITRRMRQYIYGDLNQEVGINDQAYAAYVLTQAGKLSFSDAKTYLKEVPVFNSLSNAYLGAVFYRLGDMRSSRDYFRQAEYAIELHDDNYYDSLLSARAKIVSIVSDLEKQGPINRQMSELRIESAKAIFKALNKRSYFSTQERYALAKAGFDLQALNKKPIQISKNGQLVPSSKAVSMQLGDRFQNESHDVAYVTESIDGYADPNALQSSVEFKQVSRTYFDSKGKRLNRATLHVGDRIIAKVVVNLKENIDKAMLVDYLPAGMVLENPDFTDSKELLKSLDFVSSGAEMEEFRNDRYVTSLDFSRGYEYTFYYVMRAETQGISEVPNLFIEDMYAPERFVYQPGSVSSIQIK